MKTLTTLFATSLFAANAYAADIYHGFADGNPDIAAWQPSTSVEMTGVQPGIGDVTRWSRGGSDSALFKSTRTVTPSPGRVDVYGAFQNPDLPSGGY